MPKTHKKSGTRIYTIWVNMRQRCTNPNYTGFHNYGGRGITVCQEWDESFEAFYVWAMASGYKNHLTIDRINNNHGYSPENCRWATYRQQANNLRSNRLLTYSGLTKSLSWWAAKTGIDRETLRKRLENGYSINEAMTIKKCHKRAGFVIYRGEKKHITEWAEILNININTLRSRLRKWSVERSFEERVYVEYASSDKK